MPCDVAYAQDASEQTRTLTGHIAVDIGIFDESGHEMGNAAGFRGWSGGFRTEFTISASDATPGYLPGPVRRGRWHLILGPYTVHPQGVN